MRAFSLIVLLFLIVQQSLQHSSFDQKDSSQDVLQITSNEAKQLVQYLTRSFLQPQDNGGYQRNLDGKDAINRSDGLKSGGDYSYNQDLSKNSQVNGEEQGKSINESELVQQAIRNKLQQLLSSIPSTYLPKQSPFGAPARERSLSRNKRSSNLEIYDSNRRKRHNRHYSHSAFNKAETIEQLDNDDQKIYSRSILDGAKQVSNNFNSWPFDFHSSANPNQQPSEEKQLSKTSNNYWSYWPLPTFDDTKKMIKKQGEKVHQKIAEIGQQAKQTKQTIEFLYKMYQLQNSNPLSSLPNPVNEISNNIQRLNSGLHVPNNIDSVGIFKT